MLAKPLLPIVASDRHGERISALAEMELLQQPGEVHRLLERVAQLAHTLLPTTGGASIILWDAVGETFQVSASTVTDQPADLMTRRIRSESGASRWIVENSKPIVVQDVRSDPFGANAMLEQYGLEAYVGVPLKAGDGVLGVLYALDVEPRHYSDEDLVFLTVLAGRAASAIVNARLFAEIERLAIEDDLTGVYNRRHFMALAEREFQRSRRYNRPLSFLMLDIDRFKTVNDSYGHQAGDEVIRAVAQILRQSLREADIIGRFGGDEFAVALVDADQEEAVEIAERLRRAVAEEPVLTPRAMISVTISLGATMVTRNTRTLAAVLDRADAALYTVKRQGRNGVAESARTVLRP